MSCQPWLVLCVLKECGQCQCCQILCLFSISSPHFLSWPCGVFHWGQGEVAREDYLDFIYSPGHKYWVPSVFYVAGNEEIACFLLQNGAGFSSYTLIDYPVFSKHLLRLNMQETSTSKVKVCVLERCKNDARDARMCFWTNECQAVGEHW